MSRSLRPALAGLALLLVVTGCEKDTPAATSVTPSPSKSAVATDTETSPEAEPEPDPDPDDACVLVTPAEAQSALGAAIRPGKAEKIGQGSSCRYETTDFATGTSAGKALVVTIAPGGGLSKSDWDKTWIANKYEAVPDIGDGGWFAGGMLMVWANGDVVGVSIVSLEVEATVDQVTPIAKLALPRL